MSRRPASSLPRSPSSAGAPYPRRAPGQPKSSRQQFSACGACRMRRVRCDLKDFGPVNVMQQPSCSNCRERSIKCVDEFAQIKAVKLLRRGRRLQQVEAVYGKVTDDASDVPSVPQDSTSDALLAATTMAAQSCIPHMELAFLRSSFFRRFCVQRPIIEPGEFVSRYIAHVEGTAPLDVEGRMLVMLLVTWAASFGVDEFGREDAEDTPSESHNHPHFAFDGADNTSNPKRRARMLRTEAMTREILTLVDLHGLLRRPSWDGVRVLLLLLPLTHSIQSPIERQTTYEATLSQVHSLSNFDPPPVNSGLGPYCDELIRARVFWYVYVHEGITRGLDGRRLLLDDDDLASFQGSLPPQYSASAIASPADSSRSSPSSSSPISPTFPFQSPLEPSHPRASLAYVVTTQYFALALAVSSACRAIHSSLTGPRARRRIESGISISKEAIMEIWDDLERCWDNFETLRRNPPGVGAAGGDLIRGEDVERFVSGWQMFIFGCLNIIREALPNPTQNNLAGPTERATRTSLHLSAIRRCQNFLPRVTEIMQRHLKVPSNFFAYDAGLIRDGCFFAGLLLAQGDNLDAERDVIGWDADWEEGVTACIQALGEARWVYSRSHEREKTLKAEWEARIERETSRQQVQRSPMSLPLKQSPGHSPCLDDSTPLPYSTASYSKPRILSLVSAGGQARPPLPPLTISFSPDDSRPDTVLTDDGSGSWEAYTPPPTTGSITRTVVTHSNLSPTSSPRHPTMGLLRGAAKNASPMFGNGDDVDRLSFTAEAEGTLDSQNSSIRAQWATFGTDYFDPRIILATSDPLGCDDGCSPLGRRPYFS